MTETTMEVTAMEKLFTTKELSQMGMGSESKLRKDRVRGIGIPFVYCGRIPKYRESDVLAFIEANRATSTLQRKKTSA